MAYTLRESPEVDAAFEYLGATHGTRSKIMKEAILAYAGLKRLREGAGPGEREAQYLAAWHDLEQLQASLSKILGR